MKYLKDFFNQKVPKAGTEMPAYYRGALITSEKILAVYYILSFFLISQACHHWQIMPLVMLAAVLVILLNIKRMGPRVNLGVYAIVTLVWCRWYVINLGWASGVQSLLVPLLLFVFFNIFDPPWLKITSLVVMILFRMLLFAFSLGNPPVYDISSTADITFQTLNSITMFVILALCCIHFSTNLQDAERQLRIDNQELHKEAGTDPLTQLPNRRAMMDVIAEYQKNQPDDVFCLAIADIDFFKKVNDTYGHPCGDYTLRELSALFREKAGTDYRVCRWGGEEFCFFMPEMNLDDAGKEMMDLNVAVSRMPLSFEGVDFSITITIGVEEYDFHSPIAAIIEGADRKLYMGKESGRNQVVV